MLLHRIVSIALAMLLVAGCTTDDDGVAEPPPPSASSATSPTEPSSPAPAPVEVNPEVKVDGSCTREPQQDVAGTYVEADLTVRNTGNIGAEVRVAAVWPIDASQRLSRTRTLKLRPDRTRDVTVRIALTPEDAAGIAAALERDRRCRFSARVVGAFGRPTS